MQRTGAKKIFAVYGCLLTLVFSVFSPQKSAARPYHLGLDIENTAIAQDNYVDRSGDEVALDRDRHLNLLNAAAMLWLTPKETTLFFARYDLFWQYQAETRIYGSGTKSTIKGELTNAYFNLEGEQNQFIIGIQPIEFAGGLITADDAPAVKFSDNHDQWTLGGQAAVLLDRSPMAGVTLSYEPGMFERLGLFGVWFEDKDDAVAETLTDLTDIFDWLDSGSEAELWWLGASLELFINQAFLSVTTAYEKGNMTFNHRLGQTDKQVEAFLVDIGLEANLSSFLTLELFFFTASGSDSLRDDPINAFISPLAYNPRAQIFFSPTWQDRDVTDSMTFGGGTFYGVTAPGMGVTIAAQDKILIDLAGILFYPESPPANDRDEYGWELDLEVNYFFQEKSELYFKAARFAYGSFFETEQNRSLDAALKFAAGCRFQF